MRVISPLQPSKSLQAPALVPIDGLGTLVAIGVVEIRSQLPAGGVTGVPDRLELVSEVPGDDIQGFGGWIDWCHGSWSLRVEDKSVEFFLEDGGKPAGEKGRVYVLTPGCRRRGADTRC